MAIHYNLRKNGLIAVLLCIIVVFITGADAKGAPLGVKHLDTSLGMFQDLIVEKLIDMELPDNLYDKGEFKLCTESDKEDVKAGFISFTRIFESEDFPQDEASGYFVMPLMVYVSVIFLFFWILIVFIFCICRPCAHCCCKCCNVVQHANEKKRKHREWTCIIAYMVALLFIILTFILFMAAILKVPKVATNLKDNTVEPMEKYTETFPDRLRKLNDNLPKIAENVITSAVDAIDISDAMNAAVDYLNKRFDPHLDFLSALVQYVDINDEDSTVSKVLELVKTVVKSVKNISGDLDDIGIKISDDIGEALHNAEKYLDYLNFEVLFEKIFETDDSTTDEDEFNPYKLLTEAIKPILSCFNIKTKGNTDDARGQCLADVISINIIENNKDVLKKRLKNLVDDALIDKKTGKSTLRMEDSDIDSLTSSINDIHDKFEGVRLVIDGKVKEGLLKLDFSEKDAEDYSKYYDDYGGYIVPGLLLLVLLPIALFYILPVSCALCCIKRNRKDGKCQCRCCIKCSACCLASLCPTIFILSSCIALVFALAYYSAVSILLNTDKSNFNLSEDNKDSKETPPIGCAFSHCIAGDFMYKQAVYEYYYKDDNEVWIPPTCNRETNRYTPVDKSTTSSSSSGSGDKRDAVEIIKDKLDPIIGEIVDRIPWLLTCRKTSNEKPNFDDVINSKEDKQYIEKYGNFIRAALSSDTLSNIVDILLGNTRDAKELVYSLIDPDASLNEDVFLKLIDKAVIGENGNGDGIWRDLKNPVNDATEKLKDIKEQLDSSSGSAAGYIDMVNDYIKLLIPMERATSSGSEYGTATDLATIPCDNEIVQQFADKIEDYIQYLPATVKEKAQEVAKCTSNNPPKSVDLSDVSLIDLASEVVEELPSSYGNTNDIKQVKKLIGLAEKSISDLLKIINGINTIMDDFYEILNTMESANNDLQTRLNKSPGSLASLNCKSIVEGAIESVRTTFKNILPKVDEITGASMYGLLTCYPVGAVKDGMFGIFNDFSVIRGLFILGVFFLILACMILMIATNMGPMVYHKRYSKGCCGCYHGDNDDGDDDNHGANNVVTRGNINSKVGNYNSDSYSYSDYSSNPHSDPKDDPKGGKKKNNSKKDIHASENKDKKPNGKNDSDNRGDKKGSKNGIYPDFESDSGNNRFDDKPENNYDNNINNNNGYGYFNPYQNVDNPNQNNIYSESYGAYSYPQGIY